MSPRRLFEVYRTDLRFQLKRPLVWVLVLILAFMAWGLSQGNVHISTGDSDVGGKKAWITSMFAQAQFVSITVFLIYGFFVAIAAGMTVIRDEELKIGEVLHSTPLSTGEYVWGKFASVMTAFGLVLGLDLALRAAANHLLSSAKTVEFIGPFSVWNYLFPVLLLGLPVLLFVAGTSFLVGERTRKPTLVFFLPIALLLGCVFFLWDWSPSWLDPRWNRFLMWIDPAGFRWLNETWLKVDRGVDFYNHQPMPLDGAFVVSRIAFAFLGLASVAWSGVHLRSVLQGRMSEHDRRRSAAAGAVEQGRDAEPRVATSAGSLSGLGMRTSPPGFVRSALEIAQVEFRELRSSPGLYLFGPLILLQTLGNALSKVGFLDTPALWTSGQLAVDAINTLTLLLCFKLLYYTVESFERERSVGMASIYHATAAPSAAIVFGKAVANAFVGIVVLLFAFAGGVIAMQIQGKAAVEMRPFLVTWGLLLVPTFIVWSTFIAAVQSIVRNRYTSYAVGLSVFALTGWVQMRGKMNWVWNWDLWSVLQWSDLGTYELTHSSLLLNRLLWLSAAVFFVALAVRFYPRRDLDASGVLASLRPLPLFRNATRLGAYLVAPLALGIWLNRTVQNGFQGDAEKKREKDYWAKNVETWKGAPKPSISDVVLDLELRPQASWFRARGTYTLTNVHEKPLRQIALTPGPHFKNREWTIDGSKVEPEDRAGLAVFTLSKPLGQDGRLELGFAHEGVFPDGATKNGGGTDEFILPSGVVLTSFSPSFVPVIGFIEGVGVDKDNKTNAKEYPDDFYAGITESAFGNDIPHTTHITLHAPMEYTLNASGALVSDEVKDGIRNSVWVSDRPLNFFNVIAGKWEVRRGQDTAIYYHPGHEYNLDEMIEGLDAARKYYSEWFRPYPWKELKLSEFSALASSYAQGFATNITFCESIGFLTKSEPGTHLAFTVTAHESAHQWWGNIIEPGKGPGGDILSEGMAHFSTILLIEQVKGLRDRIAFCKQIESRYGDRRQVDSERPLVKIDGSRAGDTTVTYDKGGWVFWMLLNRMGREQDLAGLRNFIRKYENGPDHPVLQDFVATMREVAPDRDSYEDFVKQWFFEVVVPEYELADAVKASIVDLEASDGGAPVLWEVHVRVTNAGTGRMPVEIAAARGERFPEKEGTKEKVSPGTVQAAETTPTTSLNPKEYRDARATITLGAGEFQEVVLRCDFDPETILVDPDALVLQLRRKLAIHRF
jgi:ABC-2 type transport system permease protein